MHLNPLFTFEMMQAFHRHIPILIRALGSSYSELLNIISDPPQGSENLLMLVSAVFPVLFRVFLILKFLFVFFFLLIWFCFYV